MHIPQQLPQFLETKALLVVSGQRAAQFYYMHRGNLSHIKAFSVELPHYLDDEGFSWRSGGGYEYGSGYVKEINKPAEQKKFLSLFHDSLWDMAKAYEIDEIHMSVPKHIHKAMTDALPNQMRNKLCCTLFGNFVEQHPFIVLEKMQNMISQRSQSHKILREEERKILEKFNAAKEALGYKHHSENAV